MKQAAKQFIVLFLIFTLLLQTSFAAIRTYEVQETDFLKLTPHAFDPDNDELTYTFGEPFDQLGEWQTTYGDQGTYLVDITVTDGQESDTRQVEVIVHAKNRQPELIREQLIVEEGQLVDLKEAIIDPDNEALIYEFQEPFDQDGTWTPDFNDAGEFVTTVNVSDNEFTITRNLLVTIIDTNQLPEIIDVFSDEGTIDVEEGDTLAFEVEARDYDEQEVTYIWQLDEQIISTQREDSYYFDFESAGEYELQAIISDGVASTAKVWQINVENTNRRPTLTLEEITVNEGDSIKLSLPLTDADDDIITYTYEEPLNENGEWTTSFDDAGEYFLEITADDGQDQTTRTLHVTVLNTDRAPQVAIPQKIYVSENELLSWQFEVSDPDEDEVTLTLSGAPSGSEFDDFTLTWEPDFETITRKSNFFYNTLNYLRLEQFLTYKRSYPIEVTACSKEACTTGLTKIIVYDTNRAPELDVTDVTLQETQRIDFEATSAYDPDNDKIKFYFSEPLSKSGSWKTTYDDEGNYTISVTASDGRAQVTKEALIIVENLNRAPTINVKEDKITVPEGKEFTIRVEAQDVDEDDLTLSVRNMPKGASFADGFFVWEPSATTVTPQEGSKTIFVEFVADDGEIQTVHPVEMTINHKNAAPTLERVTPTEEMTVKVGDVVRFEVDAQDVDQEELEYIWDFGFTQPKLLGPSAITREFTTPGSKTIELKVKDGQSTEKVTWKLNVVGEPQEEEQPKQEKPAKEPVVRPSPEPTTPPPIEQDPFRVRVYVIKHTI